jgi:hypothetical protein
MQAFSFERFAALGDLNREQSDRSGSVDDGTRRVRDALQRAGANAVPSADGDDEPVAVRIDGERKGI